MDKEPQILWMRLCFRAPWCRSLKDRRSEVKRLLVRLRQQFNLSAVESGPQGVHTRFDLSLAALVFDSAQADSLKEALLAFVESLSEAELFEIESELL